MRWVRRLRRWWRDRHRIVDECECGAELRLRDRHLLVAAHDAPDGGPGGTFMAAAFCAEHCPGRCQRGCPPVPPTPSRPDPSVPERRQS